MIITTERTIKDSIASTGVKVRQAYGRVEVVWYCGDTFRFTPQGALTALAHIDSLDDHPGVPIELTDASSAKFRVRLDGHGRLVADGYSTSVNYKELSKAVKAAAKELED